MAMLVFSEAALPPGPFLVLLLPPALWGLQGGLLNGIPLPAQELDPWSISQTGQQTETRNLTATAQLPVLQDLA